MESAQDLQRPRHRLRVQTAVVKHTFAQPGDFAILMEWNQAAIS